MKWCKNGSLEGFPFSFWQRHIPFAYLFINGKEIVLAWRYIAVRFINPLPLAFGRWK